MTAVYLQHMAWISALGAGEAAREALFADCPQGLAPTDSYTPGRVLHLGRVQQELPSLAGEPVAFRSRSNALLAAVLADLRLPLARMLERVERQRIAIVLGV